MIQENKKGVNRGIIVGCGEFEEELKRTFNVVMSAKAVKPVKEK